MLYLDSVKTFCCLVKAIQSGFILAPHTGFETDSSCLNNIPVLKLVQVEITVLLQCHCYLCPLSMCFRPATKNKNKTQAVQLQA